MEKNNFIYFGYIWRKMRQSDSKIPLNSKLSNYQHFIFFPFCIYSIFSLLFISILRGEGLTGGGSVKGGGGGCQSYFGLSNYPFEETRFCA